MPSEPAPGLARFSPEERRQAILDAARSVFAETGLAGARTKVIAERAGVAEGLVFKYFTSKDRLFELAVVDVLEELVKKVEDGAVAFAEASGSREGAEHARTFHAETVTAMREIAPLLGAVLFDRKSVGESFYLRVLGPTVSRIAQALSVSLKALPHPVDPRMLAMVFLGTHFFTALDAHYRDIDLDPDGVADDFMALLWRGLGG